jgi:hypothetical protein
LFLLSLQPYFGPTKGWGLVWRKLRKFFYFVFLLMLLGLNVYHTCEALEKVADYTLNYSSNHQKQKEETMENNQKPENQANNKVTQATLDQKSCHYIK